MRPMLWASLFLGAGCGNPQLEGPLKTCFIEIQWTAGTSCSLCGEAVLDGEVVNTDNFVVYKKDKKLGYENYDDYAAEMCSTFWPAGQGAVGVMREAKSCAELGFPETDVFTFVPPEDTTYTTEPTVESYNHDGSCDTFEMQLR